MPRRRHMVATSSQLEVLGLCLGFGLSVFGGRG